VVFICKYILKSNVSSSNTYKSVLLNFTSTWSIMSKTSFKTLHNSTTTTRIKLLHIKVRSFKINM